MDQGINEMKFNFPETKEELINWTYQKQRYMLHRNVMCLAKTRIEGRWCAYCFPVPGKNHDKEEYLWKTEGAKLSKKLAENMFPEFKELPYAC